MCVDDVGDTLEGELLSGDTHELRHDYTDRGEHGRAAVLKLGLAEPGEPLRRALFYGELEGEWIEECVRHIEPHDALFKLYHMNARYNARAKSSAPPTIFVTFQRTPTYLGETSGIEVDRGTGRVKGHGLRALAADVTICEGIGRGNRPG